MVQPRPFTGPSRAKIPRTNPIRKSDIGRHLFRAQAACLLCFSFFALCPDSAFGHSPFTSLAVAQLYPDRLELRVEMNSESAWLAMGESANSVPDLAGSMPRLKEYAAQAYQLSAGGQVLTPSKTTVDYREAEGGVVLWAFFARPAAGLLRFHATYLARLPSDHRASLVMQDEAKNLVGREILTVAKTFADLSVPPAVPSPAGKLSPISSPRTAFVRYGVPAMLVLALLLGGYWLLRRTYRT